ncbi:MAG TPA: MFS transporter [Bryobacteraceae bacterium]|nr:MFS transporter [Bryobacteraceae bacterium]
MSSETPTAGASRLPATLRSLRYRNFQLFFSGQLISLVGTWMQNVAQAWLVYRLTGSSVLLGMVGFASQIPVFLFSPAGGIVADRWSRHKVVIGTQTASMLLAFALSLLTLTGVVQVWHIFVLSAMLGVVNAFDIPARQAFLVDMVGREDLMNAIALNSSMFNGARIVGPAVAGILVASIGEGWCFFANAVSYIAVIAGLLLMRVKPHAQAPLDGSPLGHVIEGFRFVVHHAPIHALLILLGILSVTGMPFAVLMPIFADQILHGGARGLGLLMGASGVGALAGALVLATRKSVRGLGRWVALSAGAFGGTLVLFAVSRSFWLSFAILIPVGFAMMIEMGSSNTLIQTMSPDHLRGRVMSVYSMVFMGMSPLGALLAGVCAGKFGAPLTVAGGGVICAAAAGIFWMQLPAIRIAARRLIVAQQLAGGDPPQEITAGGIAVEPPAEE